MTRRARTTRPSDGGYILVAVLGVMLLLTSFMAAGSVLVRSTLHGAVADDADLAMSGLTRGGLELTAYQLFAKDLPPSSVEGRRIRFAGGTIAPRIVDEGSKVDLNGSDRQLLEALFESVGLDKGAAGAIVARIVALRGDDTKDGGSTPTAFAPAADGPDLAAIAASRQAGEYAQAAAASQGDTTRRRRPRGFQSIDQLRDVPGMTRAAWRRLAPRLTVYNPDGKIDILTADRDSLAVVPGLSPTQVEQILARRAGATKEELGALLRDSTIYVKTSAGPAFDVRIDAIAGSGQKKSIEAVIAASKSPNDPYLILDWRD